MFKNFFVTFLSILILGICSIECEASQLFADDEEIIIVIDPGHGGENLGTVANENFSEKEITMKTARALVDELSRYEEVTVYLTHEEDVDLSLKDRAVFAEEVDADFLFSLHYNASEYHTMFGAEVWIPLEAPYHAYGYQFAYLQLQEMQDMGLFIRGIKTRKNDNGKDYYGIIRECVARDIPAVIIEHCHVDEERDSAFCNSDEVYEELGRRDARAIAKFLGLDGMNSEETRSEALWGLHKDDTVLNTYLDLTEPDICVIETEHADYDNGLLTITVSAADYDTGLMYYDYSLDGGETYSKLYPWPEADMLTGTYDDSFSLTLEIPNRTMPEVILRAYNKFDIYRESNELSGFYVFRTPTDEKEPITLENESAQNADDFTEIEIVDVVQDQETTEQTSTLSINNFLLLALFAVFWILLIIFTAWFVNLSIKKNRKHR